MKPEENKKCLLCKNQVLKRTAYCILHCKQYDKFEGKQIEIIQS
jgi:hypothetical protein